MRFLSPGGATYVSNGEHQEDSPTHAAPPGLLRGAGGKRVVICDANWTNDQLLGFAVEEFPDIEGSSAAHTTPD